MWGQCKSIAQAVVKPYFEIQAVADVQDVGVDANGCITRRIGKIRYYVWSIRVPRCVYTAISLWLRDRKRARA